MLKMPWTIVVLLCLLPGLPLSANEGQKPSLPSFDYMTARDHEIKPHRRTIPVIGMDQAEYKGAHYLRLPKTHVAPPPIKKDSKVAITLQRQWCDGTCDFHTAKLSPDGVVFWGTQGVADGTYTDKIDNDALLALAKRFVAADFYSMEDSYCGAPEFSSSLSITIDGHAKGVRDCVGQWAGMPTVILELEDEVDAVARTKRWTEGAEGLVAALRAEKFDFASYEAQRILESAAVGGQTATVRELLAAGVPVKPLPAPKIDNPNVGPFEEVQLLTAASAHPDTLQVFLDSGVSKDDQFCS